LEFIQSYPEIEVFYSAMPVSGVAFVLDKGALFISRWAGSDCDTSILDAVNIFL